MKCTIKWLKALSMTLLTCLCLLGIIACKDNDGGDSSLSETGIYYLYENNTYDKSDYIELLSGNEWRDSEEETGTYSISGSTITFYYAFDGEMEELFDGTISDGVMCLDFFGEDTYYCKDGKVPSENSGSSENNGNEQTEKQYTVTYNANGGTFAGGETTLISTAKGNSTLTAPDSPMRTNYTFAGWATNSTGLNKWNFSTDKVTNNLTLYATWSQKSASILSVDGASIDGLEIFMFVDKDTDSVSLASKVVCSDDSVWKLYYDKLGQVEIPTKIAADISGKLLNGDNIFYIVVTSQDGVQVNVYELNVYRSHAISVRYYDSETLLKTETAYTGYEFATNYTPTITGYTFNDWNYSSKVLWDDLNLYVDKTANTYTVTYDVNGGDELTTTEKTVTYDSDYTLTTPTRTGYTFLGWYYGDTQLTDENGKSISVWDYAKKLTVKAKWQANEYAVMLKTNDSNAGTVTGAGNYAYDSSVTITASTNSGYTWLGWYDNNDELVTSELSYKFKMDFAVTYMAKWSKTTVTKNISAAGSITFLSDKYVNGQEVTVTATTNSGYTWLGWYNGDTQLTPESSYTFIMNEEFKTYTAKWTYYTITTNTNMNTAGTYTVYTDEKITAGEIVTLKAEPYLGYTVNWYCGQTFLSNELNYTFVMPNNNITYTAQWEVVEELKNFTFNSTNTTCVITNVIDKTAKEIILPEYITNIRSGALNGCADVENLIIPFIPTFSCTHHNASMYPLGYIFGQNEYEGSSAIRQYYHSCSTGTTTKTFYIPDTLTSVAIKNGSVDMNFFNSCATLKSITFGKGILDINADYVAYSNDLSNDINEFIVEEGNTKYHSINNCIIETNEKSLILGCKNSVIPTDGSVTSIGRDAFAVCRSLTSINIPDGVTSIGSDAFICCESLTSVTIGKSVERIDINAFFGCNSLTNVYYKGTVGDWSAITIGGSNTGLTNATLYYYSETEPVLNTDGTAYDGNYWHYNDANEIVVWVYIKEE